MTITFPKFEGRTFGLIVLILIAPSLRSWVRSALARR
jgi:hypothetical protein